MAHLEQLSSCAQMQHRSYNVAKRDNYVISDMLRSKIIWKFAAFEIGISQYI